MSRRTPLAGMPLVATGAVAAGVAALGFHMWAAARLPAARFAELAVAWTAINLVAQTVAAPLEQWHSKEAAAGHRASTALAAGALTVMASASGLVVWLLLRDSGWAAVAAVASAGIGLVWSTKGVHCGVGAPRWAAAVLVVESSARLVAVPAAGFAWAIPVGVVAAAVRPRHGRHGSGKPPRPGGGRFVAGACLSTVAAQTLMGSAPLAVWVLGGTAEEVRGVFLLFLLLRAPVVLAVATQSVLLAGLVRNDRSVLALLPRPSVTVAFAVVVAIGAGLVVPTAFDLLADVFVPAGPSGLVAVGMLLCALALLVGQRPHAYGRPLLMAGAWGCGLAAAAPVGVLAAAAGASMFWVAAVPFVAGAIAATTCAALQRPTKESDLSVPQ